MFCLDKKTSAREKLALPGTSVKPHNNRRFGSPLSRRINRLVFSAQHYGPDNRKTPYKGD
jgi:hypothetical protein